MTGKETAVVICPGRGTYNAPELGYLKRHHADKTEFLTMLDSIRRDREQITISELDGAQKYRPGTHMTGDNASLLIYACALADFMDIRARYDVLAVTGNSLGWYMALACGGALTLEGGAHLVNEMGGLMHEQGVGGQIVYPVVDENWQRSEDRELLIEDVLAEAAEMDNLHVSVSIRLGGLVVLAADKAGLSWLQKRLPEEDRYPMKLLHHAAFHSALLDHIVSAAQARLSRDLFHKPAVPLIDGRGRIWSPYGTDVADLYEYTLGHQINQTYDFSAAVEVAVKEFAPDRVIVTGPGTTMGAPVAQELIRHTWQGLTSKAMFKKVQVKEPYVISMGMEEQRGLVS